MVKTADARREHTLALTVYRSALNMMRTSLDGRGQVNVLDATRLMNSPRLYAAFLLWLLDYWPALSDPTMVSEERAMAK